MDKVAVVLGADNRFGEALCEELLRQDWFVFGGGNGRTSGARSLEERYTDNYRAIEMDVQATDSLDTAAAAVAAAAGRVDLLVSAADYYLHDSLSEGLNFDAMLGAYETNGIGPVRFIEAFLPLTDTGMKRLAFVSSAAGLIGDTEEGGDFGYGMAKTALHMAVMIMYNQLSQEGYSIALYIPADGNIPLSELPDEKVAASAQVACERFTGEGETIGRLRVTDYKGEVRRF